MRKDVRAQSFDSLQAVVNAYLQSQIYRGHIEERKYFESLGGDDQIKIALSCRTNGKKPSHQWRIPWSVLESAAMAVDQHSDDIRKCRDFEELHALIRNAAGHIRGIGALYIYDVSLRIGYALRLLPRHVYLHAGPRVGARNLGVEGDIAFVTDFPPPICDLEPCTIESFLCNMRDCLRREWGLVRVSSVSDDV